MWASSHGVVPKEEKLLGNEPKFKTTGKNILKAEVIIRAATWPFTMGQAPGLGSISITIIMFDPHSKLGGYYSHFPQRKLRLSGVNRLAKVTSQLYFGLWTIWCQSLCSSIYSILPLSLKMDTLLVPASDSQLWEDTSYSNQRIPKFKGKRGKGERYFCLNELLW